MSGTQINPLPHTHRTNIWVTPHSKVLLLTLSDHSYKSNDIWMIKLTHDRCFWQKILLVFLTRTRLWKREQNSCWHGKEPNIKPTQFQYWPSKPWTLQLAFPSASEWILCRHLQTRLEFAGKKLCWSEYLQVWIVNQNFLLTTASPICTVTSADWVKFTLSCYLWVVLIKR